MRPSIAARWVWPVRGALFLLFFSCYLKLGWTLGATGVFVHDDTLFQADTARALGDLTDPGADHYRTKVHPLFVLFFNPIGSALRHAAGSPLIAGLILVSLAGALAVVVAHGLFTRIGLDGLTSVAFALLAGFSTSHLVFASLPDTFIFTALALAVCSWLAVARPGWPRGFVPAAVFATGITSTNLVPSFFLFAASRRGGGEGRPWVRACAVFLAAVLTVAVALSLLQKAIYSSSNLFFMPEAVHEDLGYVFHPRSGSEALARAAAVLEHVAVYDLVAPKRTLVKRGRGEVPWVTFQQRRPGWFRWTGWAALSLLLALQAASLHAALRYRLLGDPLLRGLAASLLFLAGLHYFYGDDLFLYSCSWTLLVLAAMAVCLLRLGEESRAWSWTLKAALLSLAAFQIANNASFMLSLIALY
jgi:hypothetical protein